MKTCAISEMRVDESGRLLVKPASPEAHYDFIYRAGNGLRWDASEKAFVAYEPQRWSHPELLKHIIRTVRSEYDDDLVLNDATRWSNVPESLRRELRQASTGSGRADV